MRIAAVAGAAAAWPHSLSATAGLAPAPPRARAGKRILVLGGTQFIGTSFIETALRRGHQVTIFNRGRAEKRKGKVDGVEHLYGNRDPNLKSDDGAYSGMDALKGRTWDVALDTNGQYRRIVKASAELLEPSVKQYIYISSISVYKDNSKVGADETNELNTLPSDAVDLEKMGPTTGSYEYYGGHKVACETTVAGIFKGRTTNVRPGLIVGPRDETDRFTYWPVRVQKGGEVLSPGTPEDPIQIIDVRDLGDWLVHLAENDITGDFDAVGPPTGLTIGKLLDACKVASKSDAKFIWVDAAFLKENDVSPWGDMPVWIPPLEKTAGFHRRSISRGVAAGLKFRPILDTVRDTLEWWPGELERRARVAKEAMELAEKEGKPKPEMADPGVIKAGIKPEREAEVLAAWHKKQGS
jgi:2'-hydroxyisoflavone reductase